MPPSLQLMAPLILQLMLILALLLGSVTRLLVRLAYARTSGEALLQGSLRRQMLSLRLRLRRNQLELTRCQKMTLNQRTRCTRYPHVTLDRFILLCPWPWTFLRLSAALLLAAALRQGRADVSAANLLHSVSGLPRCSVVEGLR